MEHDFGKKFLKFIDILFVIEIACVLISGFVLAFNEPTRTAGISVLVSSPITLYISYMFLKSYASIVDSHERTANAAEEFVRLFDKKKIHNAEKENDNQNKIFNESGHFSDHLSDDNTIISTAVNTNEESNKYTKNCPKCNTKNYCSTDTCYNCGYKFYQDSFDEISKTSNKSNADIVAWKEKIASISTDELRARMTNTEDWQPEYRELCYKELQRRMIGNNSSGYFDIKCPSCGKLFSFTNKEIGTSSEVVCPKCNIVFKIR